MQSCPSMDAVMMVLDEAYSHLHRDSKPEPTEQGTADSITSQAEDILGTTDTEKAQSASFADKDRKDSEAALRFQEAHIANLWISCDSLCSTLTEDAWEKCQVRANGNSVVLKKYIEVGYLTVI